MIAACTADNAFYDRVQSAAKGVEAHRLRCLQFAATLRRSGTFDVVSVARLAEDRLTARERRQVQREQVRRAAAECRVSLGIGWWEWLLIRWVVLPFLRRLFFGEAG